MPGLTATAGCATEVWTDNSTFAPDVDSFQTHALAPDTCFRWTITISLAGDTQLSATSGSVRTFGSWDGSIDLYRVRAFSTQKTWSWCTAASTQMMVNLVKGRHVHSRANQYAIWKYQQHHDRYPAGVARGSDPQGWAAALNHYGAGSYAWVRSDSMASALRKAAIAMRRTGKPVGLLAMSGHHAWVMAGFTATGDPAFGDFEVTGVYIMGPLYPLQVNSGGYYDPRPGHYYTTRQLSGAFRPYRDNLGPKWSIWEGSYVTMNP